MCSHKKCQPQPPRHTEGVKPCSPKLNQVQSWVSVAEAGCAQLEQCLIRCSSFLSPSPLIWLSQLLCAGF